MRPGALDLPTLSAAILAAAAVLSAQAPAEQKPGRSDPSFSQPSIAAGVDYTLPTEAEIKAPLDRIRDYFVKRLNTFHYFPKKQ